MVWWRCTNLSTRSNSMRLWLKSSTLLCRAKANSISSIRCWYLWLFSSLVMMMMMMAMMMRRWRMRMKTNSIRSIRCWYYGCYEHRILIQVHTSFWPIVNSKQNSWRKFVYRIYYRYGRPYKGVQTRGSHECRSDGLDFLHITKFGLVQEIKLMYIAKKKCFCEAEKWGR